MIYTKRVQNLSATLIQSLFYKKLNIRLDRFSAISLSEIGLPSKILTLYNKKLKKTKDVENSILLLKLESIKQLSVLKQKNSILVKSNPIKFFFLRFFQSKKEYNLIKNKILKEFHNARQNVIKEKKQIKTINTSITSKIDSFNPSIFISSIQYLNNDIYNLAKSNPKKAEDLAKLVNHKFKSLERIFIK